MLSAEELKRFGLLTMDKDSCDGCVFDGADTTKMIICKVIECDEKDASVIYYGTDTDINDILDYIKKKEEIAKLHI